MINNVLYLGPAGSYSEKAKECFSTYYSTNCEFIIEDSIYKIIRRLKEVNSESYAAVIPIENSVEGVVRETQDNLWSLAEFGYRILAETKMPIEHSLISFGQKSEIKVVTSHPQALAQCRDFIYRNWADDIVLQPVLSTSLAVSSLSADNPTVAAIGNSSCASLYGVPVLETSINDEPNNSTRFVLLSKQAPTKADENKISIVFSTENKSGALNKVLGVFEKYDLNLSYIDSRPSKKELGEYVFFVDFAGYIEDSTVAMALVEIQPYVSAFEILSKGANCV